LSTSLILALAFLAGPAPSLGLWHRSTVRSKARIASLERLYAFTVTLAGLSDADDIIEVSLGQVGRMLAAGHVEIRLPDELGGFRYRSGGGHVDREPAPATGLEAGVAAQRRAVLVPRARRAVMPEGYGRRDLLAVPVPLGDLGTAVMVLADHTDEHGTFDAEDLRLAEAVAASLGTALVSSQRQDLLRLEVAAREYQALHDSLTGLGNRGLFGQWVDGALRTRAPRQSVGVMLMDLDGFKDINDTLGHHTGDRVLQEVADRVRSELGRDRLAARLGGDEFALVVPGSTGVDDLLEIAWSVTGMEALLRWRHAQFGAIPPAEFIPVAEQSGLIEPLTWWVLESALAELAAWRATGYELSMAVNLSARCLSGRDVQDRLRQILAGTGIPASDLTLEITESLMVADPDGSQRVLEDLAALGVRIAIDDFGTGYSSLSRLRRLPVHTVKIDRSFVMAMHRDEGDEAIVRATIELARNMGHEVIAEGVERQDTWDRLAVLGCHQVQGHVLAPAMPIDICRSWLTSRQSPGMAAIRPLRRSKGA